MKQVLELVDQRNRGFCFSLSPCILYYAMYLVVPKKFPLSSGLLIKDLLSAKKRSLVEKVHVRRICYKNTIANVTDRGTRVQSQLLGSGDGMVLSQSHSLFLRDCGRLIALWFSFMVFLYPHLCPVTLNPSPVLTLDSAIWCTLANGMLAYMMKVEIWKVCPHFLSYSSDFVMRLWPD